MTKDKYIKEISKKLLCKKDKKAEIIKQITSDIDIAIENGSKIEDVLVNMGTPSEVASEFNDNFDERDKEKISKEIFDVQAQLLATILELHYVEADYFSAVDIYLENELIWYYYLLFYFFII